MNNENNNNLFDMYNAGDSGENNSDNIQQVNLISEKKETESLINEEKDTKEDKKEKSKFFGKKEDKKEKKDTKPVPDAVKKEALKGTDDIEYLSDEALLRIYVGPNYDSISKGVFSIPSLLFGVYYLLYRKMYIISVPCIVALVMTILYVGREAGMVVSALIGLLGIVFAFSFKSLYMAKAKKFVGTLQATNLSNTDKKRRALAAGGVNGTVYLIFLGIWALNGFLYYKDNQDQYKNILKNVVDPEIVYTIPSWAEKNVNVFSDDDAIAKDNVYASHDKIFTYRDDSSSCKYRIFYTNEYNTSNKELNIEVSNFMSNKFNKNAEFDNKKINNFDYKHYYDSEAKTHYYIHMSDKLLTLFKVELEKDDSKTCEKITNEMLETAKEYENNGKKYN